MTSAGRNLVRVFLDQGEDLEVGIKLWCTWRTEPGAKALSAWILNSIKSAIHFFERP
jgi:hypothetical protein